MKKSGINILLIVLVVICLVVIIIQGKKLSDCQDEPERICHQEDTNPLEENRDYDCQFTMTYHIVDLLDDYIAKPYSSSYVVVDQFQEDKVIAHPIPVKLKKGLEKDKTYEFTYIVRGNGMINQMEDIYKYITDNQDKPTEPDVLRVNLEIKETDKVGLEQIQELICQ